MNKKNTCSAHDAAKLAYHAVLEPFVKAIVNKKIYSCIIRNSYSRDSREAIWENTNKLLYEKGF
jgi:hypothetical protein